MDDFNKQLRLTIGDLTVAALMANAQRDTMAAELAASQEKVKELEEKIALDA